MFLLLVFFLIISPLSYAGVDFSMASPKPEQVKKMTEQSKLNLKAYMDEVLMIYDKGFGGSLSPRISGNLEAMMVRIKVIYKEGRYSELEKGIKTVNSYVLSYPEFFGYSEFKTSLKNNYNSILSELNFLNSWSQVGSSFYGGSEPCVLNKNVC